MGWEGIGKGKGWVLPCAVDGFAGMRRCLGIEVVVFNFSTEIPFFVILRSWKR